MAQDRPTKIPSAMTAGSTLRMTLDFEDILASAGGSIVMYIRGPADIPDSDFTYGTDGDSFTIDVPASLTTNWKAGTYQYTIKHTDATATDPVDSGRIEILDDPANETNIEARTFTEIFLDRLKEVAKEIALNTYKTIQIQDTIYSSFNLKDLHELIETYEAKLVREQLADQSKQGANTQFDVSVSFTD